MKLKLEKLITKGGNRDIYEHPDDPTLVVKVMTKLHNNRNGNEVEWEIWNNIRNTEYSDMFCPCVELTEEGHLVMKRCEPLKETKKIDYTYILGIRMGDTHSPKNMGMLNGKKVILDYGEPCNLALIKKIKQKEQT